METYGKFRKKLKKKNIELRKDLDNANDENKKTRLRSLINENEILIINRFLSEGIAIRK